MLAGLNSTDLYQCDGLIKRLSVNAANCRTQVFLTAQNL
jgi:hypothetical protein